MSNPSLSAAIGEALQKLLNLRVLGPITLEVWDTLEIGYLMQTIFGTLINKAEITSQDKLLHSATLFIPIVNGLQATVTMMTWPTTLSEAHEEAKEKFFSVAGMFAEQQEFAGALQFDLFLGEQEAPELLIAWLPFPHAFPQLPDALHKSLLPWGSRRRSQESVDNSAPGTREILELAQIAWRLSAAMRECVDYSSGEEGPRLGFVEARDRCIELVKPFNAAVLKVKLVHSMPISRFDDTWLPHNLKNALHFGSLPATLKAGLLRVWGPEARDRFEQAWTRLGFADPDRPDEELLDELIDSPLIIRPRDNVSLSPQPVEVFISYAWSDKTRGARDIYEFVTQSGFSAWLDEE